MAQGNFKSIEEQEEMFYKCNGLHDAIIEHLNQINNLAVSYGTERFTPRNFIPNDFYYKNHRDRYGAYHARVETDRSIVDYYFRQVFSQEYAQIERDIRFDMGIF